MPVVVRRIEPGDEARFKQARLTALRDTPSAFGSTYEREAAFSDDVWRERVLASAIGDDRAMFLALDGDDVDGILGGYSEADTDEVDVISMWTAPAARRRGVARALVTAVLEWAATAGYRSASLWVTRGNDAAQSLYEAMGFEVTGDVQPLPSDPCRDEIRMIRRSL
jgi:ribosomal protein S18 acetylase RimI-like enzyme